MLAALVYHPISTSRAPGLPRRRRLMTARASCPEPVAAASRTSVTRGSAGLPLDRGPGPHQFPDRDLPANGSTALKSWHRRWSSRPDPCTCRRHRGKCGAACATPTPKLSGGAAPPRLAVATARAPGSACRAAGRSGRPWARPRPRCCARADRAQPDQPRGPRDEAPGRSTLARRIALAIGIPLALMGRVLHAFQMPDQLIDGRAAGEGACRPKRCAEPRPRSPQPSRP